LETAWKLIQATGSFRVTEEVGILLIEQLVDLVIRAGARVRNSVEAERVHSLAEDVRDMILTLLEDAVTGRREPPTLDGRRLLNTGEVARYTSYSLKTIYRAVESGELRCGRRKRGVTLKFRLRDVDAWLARGHPEP
jgi:excisionase family DNA binding protein